jgi:hypothetical protein
MQPWRSSSAPAGRQASRGRRLARRGLGQLDRQRSCDGWRVRLGRVERGVIPIGFCPAWHWPSSMPTARVESHLLSADQPCSAGAAQPNRHRSSGHTMARQMASIPDESRASRRLECATRWRRRAVLREPSAGQCSRQGRACSSTSCLADSQRRVVATGALSVSRPGYYCLRRQRRRRPRGAEPSKEDGRPVSALCITDRRSLRRQRFSCCWLRLSVSPNSGSAPPLLLRLLPADGQAHRLDVLWFSRLADGRRRRGASAVVKDSQSRQGVRVGEDRRP